MQGWVKGGMQEGRREGWRDRCAPGRCVASAVCRAGSGRLRAAPRPPRRPRSLRARGPVLRWAGAGCRRLNLSAAARNQKSHRSFPADIHGAFSAPAVPSPAAPGTGRAGSPEPGTGHQAPGSSAAEPPSMHRGSQQPPPSQGLQHPGHPLGYW